ncbi:MAG TPA: hypothetical protein VJ957_02700 [Longimicrobiales bacterium]|nr:hypothetical protein [Longimicrobiales bacterium]
MLESSSATDAAAEQLIARRRQRLERILQRPLERPSPSGIPEDRRQFLREEAEELYWNELSWEQLTGEEGLEESGLVEFTFPGFLAMMEGLLLRETTPDARAPATPRPEVVEDVLQFLARRRLALGAAANAHARTEAEVVTRLMDLVLYRLHDVPVEEVERLEQAPEE